MNFKCLIKRDTSARWKDANPVLRLGEIVMAQINEDTFLYKIGDGERTWKELPYVDLNEVSEFRLYTDQHSVVVDMRPEVPQIVELELEGKKFGGEIVK